MIDILHPLIILFPTLCVSFFAARQLGYHASLVFIALLSALALLSGALAILLPLSQVVLFIYIALYILSAIILISNRHTLFETIKAHWIWVLVLAIIYSLWLTMDRVVTRWDNFSHWLLAPKSFNYTSEIFNWDIVDAYSYPPFAPLMLYFSKGFALFKEDHAVFLHLALFLILCIPILENLLSSATTLVGKITNGILGILTALSLLNILLLLTGEIQSFYSDVIAMLLIGLNSFLLYKFITNTSYKALYLLIPLSISLTLVRPGGLALALAVLGTFLLATLFIAILKQIEWRKALSLSGLVLLIIVSCFTANRLWESSVTQRYGSEAFLNRITPKTDVYLKILFDTEDEKAKLVRTKVTDVFRKHTTMLPRFNGSLVEQFGQKWSQQKFPNSMLYWLGIVLFLFLITVYQLRGNRKRLWILCSAFTITLGTLALYMLSILVSAYSRTGLLGGFPRYSFIYIAGIMLYFFMVIFSEKEFRARIPMLIFSLFILATTPFVLGTVFKNPTGQVRDVTFDNKENLRRHEARGVVGARAQSSLSTISPGDKTYIIWQGNNSYLYWLTRGELGGVITNDNSCPHVIVEKQNKINARRCGYSPQELHSLLASENYDWLFVGHAGEGFRTYINEISTELPENFLSSGEESFLLKVNERNLEFTKYLSSK